MRNNRLFMLACLVSGLCLSLAVDAEAQDTDLGLFSSSGGNAPPNILILVDTSGSMGKAPSGGCATGGGGGKKSKDGGGGDGDCTKRTLASQAIIDLVNATNPVDGFGGRVENARLGFAIFTKSGARLMVPLGSDDPEDTIIALNADGGEYLKSLGGNSHGLAMTDMYRYLHYPTAWGPLPVWPDPVLEAPDGIQPVPGPIPEVWDAECRQTFLVHVDDGLWGGNDGGLYGDCGDYNGDGTTETCWEEFIEDGAPFKCESDIWMNDISYKALNSDFSDAIADQQPVITHVIGFDIDFPCLEDTGLAGGGTYHTASNGTEFTQALFDVTAHIFDNLTVSFSSATVSSSRTAFSDGFYVAYLVTDSSDPFWEGHLEAYRIAPDGSVLDRLNNPAMDATGTFLDPRNPYWDVADRLKDPLHPTRKIYTTKAGSRTAFTTANIVSTDLDIEDADLPKYIEGSPFATHEDLADAMVDYLTGTDAFDKDEDTVFNEPRDKILGDIFHANAVLIGPPPIALAAEDGFGPPETAGTFLAMHGRRDRRLLIGANDGMLHGIEAGSYQTGDNPITPEGEDGYYEMGTGNEDFAWIPGQLLPTLKYIPRNLPRKYYFVDGTHDEGRRRVDDRLRDRLPQGRKRLPGARRDRSLGGRRNARSLPEAPLGARRPERAVRRVLVADDHHARQGRGRRRQRRPLWCGRR